MSKIHIIGGPGSGKTTLAKEISSRFHIPHHDLDFVKTEDMPSIAEQSAWITEGIYLVWTEPMLYQSDFIVLLESTWPVAAWRIIYRHISNSLRGTNPYPGINGVKLLFKLLKGTRSYYLNEDDLTTPTIASVQAYLDQHKKIAEPPTPEFMQMYSEQYGELAEPPTEIFVRFYLERYKEKVIVVKTRADRNRLLEFLANK